jgi:hypothetical protein
MRHLADGRNSIRRAPTGLAIIQSEVMTERGFTAQQDILDEDGLQNLDEDNLWMKIINLRYNVHLVTLTRTVKGAKAIKELLRPHRMTSLRFQGLGKTSHQAETAIVNRENI